MNTLFDEIEGLGLYKATSSIGDNVYSLDTELDTKFSQFKGTSAPNGYVYHDFVSEFIVNVFENLTSDRYDILLYDKIFLTRKTNNSYFPIAVLFD